MRVKVETAIGNLDDDHARAFLCDVIETCDNKKVSTLELQKFSRDALEMLLKLEHRQVHPDVEAIANVERDLRKKCGTRSSLCSSLRHSFESWSIFRHFLFLVCTAKLQLW